MGNDVLDGAFGPQSCSVPLQSGARHAGICFILALAAPRRDRIHKNSDFSAQAV